MEKNISSAEDLKTIRKIMEESTRFLSLSGLSGIFAGVFAISGAIIAWLLILDQNAVLTDNYLAGLNDPESVIITVRLAIIAMLVLFLSVFFAFYFSRRKAMLSGKKIWTPVSKRLLINLVVPLGTGGLFVLIALIQGHYSMAIPGLLIFYGLSLVNAGKFTYSEVFYLGILEIITGLASLFYPGAGLLFWSFGFGLLHLAYGFFMYRKYEA
jgi:hypothetical protein